MSGFQPQQNNPPPYGQAPAAPGGFGPPGGPRPAGGPGMRPQGPGFGGPPRGPPVPAPGAGFGGMANGVGPGRPAGQPGGPPGVAGGGMRPPGAPAGAAAGPPGFQPPAPIRTSSGPPGPTAQPPAPGGFRPPGQPMSQPGGQQARPLGGAQMFRPPAPSAPPGYGAPPTGPPGAYPPQMQSMGYGPSQPTQPGMPGGYAGPPGPGPYGATPAMPGYDAGATGRVLDHFESLTLGPAAPGQSADVGVNPEYFPRPTGDAQEAAVKAPEPVHPGNAPSRFIRLTVNAVPNSQALRARFQLPLGAIVHPLADPQDVPVVNLGSAGIVRCKRCRTYMNPFVQWTDGGRRYQCNVCAQMNEVPVEYFCSLDANNVRVDSEERPELSRGTVEYIAPAEYMVRPPMPPTFFFVIDVSYAAVSAGVLPTVVESIKQSLDSLPGGERTKIGILTFDTHLHFYNLKSSLSQPQMMVVAEIEEPFVPCLPDDLLVNLGESRSVVEALLDSLPTTFAHNSSAESVMGPALQAAFMIMSGIGGKLLLFQSSIPSLGVGKIKNRDNAAAWGTDNEYKMRVPEDPFFKKFAAECSRVQISVDVFSFSSQYTDLASLGSLPKYTCGQVYYYPGFNAQRDGVKVHNEIVHNLTRTTGWEAVMRIRCSKGLRISNFHGHFFIRSTDLLALPQVDPDKAFAVQIAHEESVLTSPTAYMQCALLYTSSTGERRIRVHTLAMPVVAELGDLYRAADGGALASLLGKLAVEKAYTARLEETRQAIQHKVTLALKEFRMLHSQHTRGSLPHNKLIFPESLKHLPLWTLGLMKCAALRGTARDVNTDERIAVGLEIMAASVPNLLRLIYPNLYPVYDPAGDWGKPSPSGGVVLPPTMPLATDALNGSGAYLLDNGRIFVLWLGRTISRDFLAQVFGVDPAHPPQDSLGLAVEPARNNELSQRINALLRALRAGRANYQNCFVVRQGSPTEVHVLAYFLEDRGPGPYSYVELMAAIHKQVLSSR
ncbi:hypothetical protein WJX72_009241 [[Myrmecia] bisecta]|uniref:Uncharacterized protein n=1 Tax=[Myrmecia] bisecta TaxID=41462 RepID=A0AAW1PU98_9CHLO